MNMKGRTIAIAVVSLLVLTALATVVEAKGRPTFTEDQQGNKWVLKNDQISIWFQGKKPMLKVFRTGQDGNRTGYMLKISGLFEKDKSGSTVANINLESARPQDWETHTVQTNTTLNLSMSADITQPGANGGSAQVTFVFHVDTSSSEVKFDMLVDDWQWKSADRANATLNLLLFTVDQGMTKKSGDEVTVGSVGYVKWAPTALADGRTINVASSTGSTNGTAHLTLTFQGSGNASHLVYDPTVGVTKASTGGAVPALGLVAAIVVIAVAAYVVSRRRK